ncbi:cysteine hydrolase [Anaerosacchariphilus sp. NSJ-68]|uniref:nicotinamidase n=2 Tax=Lachnospiraceae TaxID=186803 RepID=A0A923LE46_9FIRM|nr:MULTISPECIES: isochorismatase family cysteine hydrolase [Lachnospiraceae]MBC5660631.1 cysteine hydrolase [Anaerosacchariphilus hominis]MBC5699494.1 cysteine hydrolase [Roseburia difficilis]
MRKILVVIDMQKDFVDGSLGTPEAAGIVDAVVNEIGEYAPENIYATRDTHPENYLETQEGRMLPVVHCVKGTPGWEINEKVAAALQGAEVIDKPTFGSRILAEKLAALAEKEKIQVTLVGLCTDICVVSNALLIKAYLPEIQVRVKADCCAGVTPASHEAALTTMKMCQIEVL